MTTKLAEARGGELNAATALRKLRLTLKRTLIRAEADALNATGANDEHVSLRKTLLSANLKVMEAGRTAPKLMLDVV